MNKSLFIGTICLAFPGWALTVNVQSVTPQQAILQYTAPNTGTCTVAVSTASAYTPLINDVNTALYPNSNVDNRTGAISNGTSRTFLVGARTTAVASDGNTYSRSLQAFSTYFYQVTCGALTAGGTFYTSNIQLGNNYPMLPPFQAGRYGNYGWPTINWNDQTQVYIDPETGLATKRMGAPGWYGRYLDNQVFETAIDTNAVWTNVTNSTSGTSTTLASYNGTGGQPIFLPFDPSSLLGLIGEQTSPWEDNHSIDNIMVRTFGSSSSSSTLDACISSDSGQTCASAVEPIATMTAALGNPTTTYPSLCANQDTGKNCFPNYGFWGGWNFTPTRLQVSGLSGTVNVTSSHTVTWASGAWFDVRWSSGTRFYIAGSSPACTNNLCTIISMQGSSVLTINETLGNLTGAAYKSANSGLRVWVAPGGVQQSSVSFNFAFDDSMMTHHGEGYYAMCSTHTFTVDHAADGVTSIPPVPGELCYVDNVEYSDFFSIFLFIPSTGESRLITPVYITNPGDASQDQNKYFYGLLKGDFFSPTDPYSLYASVITNGGTSIFKGTYSSSTYHFAAYAHSLYPSGTSSFQPGEDTASPGIAWPDTGFTWSNIQKASQGLDSDTQIAAYDVQYDTNIYNPAQVTSFTGGKEIMENYSALGNESVALLHGFDVLTGSITLSANTYTNWAARWGSLHAPLVTGGWVLEINNSLGGAYAWIGSTNVVVSGPFSFTPSKVFKSGSFSADTSITPSSPADACPAIPAFLTNNVPPNVAQYGYSANPVCMTFQSQMACSSTPYVTAGGYHAEAHKWPCEYNSNFSELSPISVGDGFVINNGSYSVLNNQEMLLIISTQSLGGGNYQFTAVRGIQFIPGVGEIFSGAPNGWNGAMLAPDGICPYYYGGCGTGSGAWFNVASTGAVANYYLDPQASYSHLDVGDGPTPGATSLCQSIQCRYNIPFVQQLNLAGGSFVNANMFGNGTFNGDSGGLTYQGYPSVHQTAAPSTEKVWMTDYHHLNPSSGTGEEVASVVGNVTYFQVATTTNVYEFTAVAGGVDYKNLPVIAYAGPALLKDISSPATGNIITDATPWEYCVALNSNECRTGSSAGQVYMTVPSVNQTGPLGAFRQTGLYGLYCLSNIYDDYMPCAASPNVMYAQGIQQDISRQDPNRSNWRSLGMGFSGPGRQFQFEAMPPDPTAQWIFSDGFFLDGVREDLIGVQVPPFPNPQDRTTNKSQYVNVPITIGAYAAAPNVRVTFGYAENGPPNAFYCTARADACWATSTSPFSYASKSPSFTSCSGGCTVNIPAIPGRTVYYEVDREDANNNIFLGQLQMTQLP
jgi:hypothetical protein